LVKQEADYPTKGKGLAMLCLAPGDAGTPFWLV
jgi:hypothetical protein